MADRACWALMDHRGGCVELEAEVLCVFTDDEIAKDSAEYLNRLFPDGAAGGLVENFTLREVPLIQGMRPEELSERMAILIGRTT